MAAAAEDVDMLGMRFYGIALTNPHGKCPSLGCDEQSQSAASVIERVLIQNPHARRRLHVAPLSNAFPRKIIDNNRACADQYVHKKVNCVRYSDAMASDGSPYYGRNEIEYAALFARAGTPAVAAAVLLDTHTFGAMPPKRGICAECTRWKREVTSDLKESTRWWRLYNADGLPAREEYRCGRWKDRSQCRDGWETQALMIGVDFTNVACVKAAKALWRSLRGSGIACDIWAVSPTVNYLIRKAREAGLESSPRVKYATLLLEFNDHNTRAVMYEVASAVAHWVAANTAHDAVPSEVQAHAERLRRAREQKVDLAATAVARAESDEAAAEAADSTRA